MIRAAVLLSAVIVGVFTSGCQKESKRATPAAPYRPAMPGLNAARPGSGALGTKGVDGSLSGDSSKDSATPQQRVARAQSQEINNTDDQATAGPSVAAQPATPGATTHTDLTDTAPETVATTEAPAAAPVAQNTPPAQVAPAAPADTSVTPAPADNAVAAPSIAAQPIATPNNTSTSIDPFPAVPGKEKPDQAAPTATQAVSIAMSATLSEIKHAEDPKWTPGLPRDPVTQPNITHNGRSDRSAIYVDASNDQLMAHAWEDSYNANINLIPGNKVFSTSINGVQLTSADGKAYWLTVSAMENNNPVTLQFYGVRKTHAQKAASKGQQPKDASTADQFTRSFDLEQSLQTQNPAPLIYRYHAYVHCGDESETSCANATIEVRRYELKEKNGDKHIAQAAIVYRLGPAIVTFVNPLFVPRKAEDPAPDQNVANFTQFLIDTAFNVCISEKADASAETLEKLKPQCPSDTKVTTGASDVLMRCWAVAGGGSQCDVIFVNEGDKAESYFGKSLKIIGENVVSTKDEYQNVVDLSNAGRDAWFANKSVQLMSNDGNGALNFKLKFENSTQDMRISVTSNFGKTFVPEKRPTQPITTSDAGAHKRTKPKAKKNRST